MKRRRGRRRKKLLDDLQDRRGYSHSKEEALDRTMWWKRLEESLDLLSDRILNERINEILWIMISEWRPPEGERKFSICTH